MGMPLVWVVAVGCVLLEVALGRGYRGVASTPALIWVGTELPGLAVLVGALTLAWRRRLGGAGLLGLQVVLGAALALATSPPQFFALLVLVPGLAYLGRPAKVPELVESAAADMARAAEKLETVCGWTERLVLADSVEATVAELAREIRPCQAARVLREGEDWPELARQAWQHGRSSHRERAVALPLGREGVLFLGGGDFNATDLSQLELLAPVAARALQAARGKARIRQRVELMQGLLEGVHALLATSSLEEALQRAVPHTSGMVVRRGEVLRRWGPRPAQVPSVAVVTEGSLEDGMLAAPLLGAESSEGAILLFRTERFERAQLTAVTVLGSLAALTLANEEQTAQLAETGKLAAVGQLAAGVAHEINNPLMAIAMDAELLATLPEGAGRQEVLESVRAAVERCRQITARFLSYARGGAGERGPLELCPGARVLARAAELEQIVEILTDNGRRAGGEVRVERFAEGQRGVVEVRDTGSGIDPAVQGRIFEPFFTTREVGQGMGLGLFLAYTMARSLQGTLELRSSRPGETVFRLSLPLLE